MLEGARVATATRRSVRKTSFGRRLEMSEKLQGYARQIAATRPPAGGIGIFWIGQAGFILRGQRTTLAVGATRVTGAAPDVPITIGDSRITPIPACHGVDVADAYSFGLTPGEHRYLGYVIEIDGVRLFHSGDTIRYDGMAERLRALDVEVALLPINGRSPEREALELVGNLSAHEAADLAADAGVRAVIPMHYELFAHNSGRAGDLVDRATAEHPELAVHVLPRYGGMLYSA